MKKAAVVGQMTHVATHAATHPISTASYVFGIVRGVSAGVIRTAADLLSRPMDHQTEDPTGVVPFEPRPAAPQVAPDPPGESFVTEPTAVTRISAHGRGGHDADVDEWFDEARRELGEDDPAAGGVVEALERGDRPGEDQVDRAAVKEVLTESERLRGISD